MLLWLLAGCGGAGANTNANANSAAAANENANSTKTNVEELGMLANIPFEAEDIAWKEDAARKHLIAVLRFSPEDAQKVIADAATRGTPQHVTLSSESWFPAELVAQSDMTGDDTLKGTAYAADAFYQEPYTAGRIVRIDGTDYFILELSKK
jgi:hypothetical protein